MKPQLPLVALRTILIIVLIMTFCLGVVAYVSGDVSLKVGQVVYGSTISELTPQIDYLLKMMGAYLITLGILNILAIADPVKYQAIVYADALMAALRALQRFVNADAIQEAFGISMTRIYVNASVMLVGAIALVVLLAAVKKAQQNEPQAA